MSFDVLRRRSLSFVSGSTHITSLCVLHKFLLQILQSLFLNILWRWENLAEVWLEAAEWMCQTVSLGKFGASLVWTSRPSEEHIKKCWQRWEREFPLSSPSGPPANLHGPPLISPGHLYLLSPGLLLLLLITRSVHAIVFQMKNTACHSLETRPLIPMSTAQIIWHVLSWFYWKATCVIIMLFVYDVWLILWEV